MEKPDNHIENIIGRKLTGQITEEEEAMLNDWLAANEENIRYFREVKRIYEEAEADKQELPAIDIDQEWARFRQSVAPASEKPTTTRWWRLAASILLVSVLGYFLWSNSFEAKTITIYAQTTGEQIILPDSSIITLNKGAELTYPRQFSQQNRQVELTGEAFFEITRNENKPFRVNLGLSNVEVLGTSFNIDARPDNDKVEVIVNTGKVRFANTVTNEAVILTKGEKGTLMKQNNMIAKTQNTDVNFLAWKTRKIVFNDVELDEVIKTLNKLYEKQITFATEVGPNCRVTVTFDNQSIEAILSVLEVTLDLEYKKSGDIIEVVKTGC